jgi:hypothetical protein
MAIYRGPGGAGDATADATNAASVANGYATAAASSASNAASSSAAAANSAINSANSATAAAASALTASTASTNALAAETNAETAETNAETAQTAAEAARDASINLANNFAVTATTLSAGSSATASYNSGTYTLALGIPTGATGATGATGSTGATGAQGPEGLRWLGAYAGGTAYIVDDAVSYNGSSYICKLASTGNLPTNTTYWDVLAAQGASGSGAGDVIGPSSAVNNRFAAFDGITGKLIKDSTYSSASFEPADATILKSAAIGVTVQGYDAQLADVAGLAVTDGNFIVGNGTNFVAESGNTARTSLGLGTGDSPQFTAVNVGNASDTTVTRVSAGVIAVEGSNVLMASNIGASVQAYDAELQAISGLSANGLVTRTSSSTAEARTITGTTNVITVTNGDGVSGNPTLTTGSLVARTDTAQTFTASQRGTVTTDNDGSFDLSVTNNFACTPTGAFTLTFTNMTAGQSGFILLVNGSNYTVSAHANTKVVSGSLTTISATGTYLLSYWTNGTNTYVVNSGALA